MTQNISINRRLNDFKTIFALYARVAKNEKVYRVDKFTIRKFTLK